MAGTPLSNRWASQFTHLVSKQPRTISNWRWEAHRVTARRTRGGRPRTCGLKPFSTVFLAKSTYEDSRTNIKDADPDIPILKEAKAEYAKLQ